MHRLAALLLALMLPMLVNGAETSRVEDVIGDTYELRMQTTSEWSSGSSSGSSNTHNLLIERLVALRDEGAIELTFDLPEETPEEHRARSWQFPARVLKVPSQAFALLNAEELAARNRAWLDAGELPQSACGHWVFTWTAIKIECDPLSVLRQLATFDLRHSELSEGAQFVAPGALLPVPLRMAPAAAGGTSYVAEMQIDPEVVRQERAEAAVAAAEMNGRPPVTIEAALASLSGEQISGTLIVTFEVDAAARVTRSTSVSTIEVIDADGSVERATTTTTIDRRLISSGDEGA